MTELESELLCTDSTALLTTVTKLFTLYVLRLHSDYTAVATKMAIFWDVILCTLIKIH
jgi:hypothetical protein